MARARALYQPRTSNTSKLPAQHMLDAWILIHNSRDLKIVLSIYRKAYPDSDLDVAQCSWEDVLDQMAQAKSNYDSNIERSRIRRPIKKLIQASEYITEYLDLIPDDYGLCFVKGGLALVFKVRDRNL
jgi:hypothetical protein